MSWIASFSTMHWLFAINIMLLLACLLMFRHDGRSMQRPCIMLLMNLLILRIMHKFDLDDALFIGIEIVVFASVITLCIVQKFIPKAIPWRT